MMTCAASESFAVEPGDFTNYLRGATQGQPLGALPPPGLYGGFALDATGLGSSPGKGNQSTAVATNPAFGYGESLLWVPGWTIFGASYGATIVQGEYFGLAASSVNPPFATSSITGPRACQYELHPDHLVLDPRPWLVHRSGLDLCRPDRLAVG